MESLYLLIPVSLAIVALAVWVFFRMSDTGQFDDMEGPAHSILMDDDRPGARERHGRDGRDRVDQGAGNDPDPDAGARHDPGDRNAAGPDVGTGPERGVQAPSAPPRDRL